MEIILVNNPLHRYELLIIFLLDLQIHCDACVVQKLLQLQHPRVGHSTLSICVFSLIKFYLLIVSVIFTIMLYHYQLTLLSLLHSKYSCVLPCLRFRVKADKINCFLVSQSIKQNIFIRTIIRCQLNKNVLSISFDDHRYYNLYPLYLFTFNYNCNALRVFVLPVVFIKIFSFVKVFPESKIRVQIVSATVKSIGNLFYTIHRLYIRQNLKILCN